MLDPGPGIAKRGGAVEAETVGAVISKLRARGLVDDEAFARFWKENRKQKARNRPLQVTEIINSTRKL